MKKKNEKEEKEEKEVKVIDVNGKELNYPTLELAQFYVENNGGKIVAR